MPCRTLPWFASALAVLLLAVASIRPDQPDRPTVRSRKFLFTYTATVTGLAPGEKAHVWLPVPPSNEDQGVRIVSTQELAAGGRINTDPRTGNRMLYREATVNAEGKIPLQVVYEVTRREIKGEQGKELNEDGEALARYLKADALVPIDGKPLELIRGLALPTDEMGTARVLYDVVNGHMKYSKDNPGGGRGDSVWACASGLGNCSDFHSLFISLARSRKIPAKFEIGFPLPPKRGEGEIAAYHCWAKFRPQSKGWVPVDISEANKNPKWKDYYFGNLTEDRVLFSTGRDLDLIPRQEGASLNFFIYPYVEVNGKAYPQDKIQRRFWYKDQ
jgi:transglutaminase-like putative cysteine protease